MIVSGLQVRAALSRAALIAIGVLVALGVLATVLVLVDFLAKWMTSGPSEEWMRLVSVLLFVVAGVYLVGCVLAVFLAGLESVRRVPVKGDCLLSAIVAKVNG